MTLGSELTYTVSLGDMSGTPGEAAPGIILFYTPRTDPAQSNYVYASIKMAKPDYVLSVSISGDVNGYPQVGSLLTATPTCLISCDVVNYTWQIETSAGSGLFTSITGAVNSTYLPVSGDQLRRIKAIAKRSGD